MSFHHLSRIFTRLGVLVCFAVVPSLAAQQPPQKPEAPAPAKKAKKVWTNDDLEALRYTARVSTASSETPPAPPADESAAAEETPAAGETPAPSEQKEDPAEKLRKRLEPLRVELDSIDAQLRSLRQARSSGRTTAGGIDVTKTPGGMNTDDQIALLGKRRADLLRQIADIEDEARRAGIPPGSIR